MMSDVINDEELDKLILESEIALRKTRRMVEFLRAVCRKEAQILSRSEQIPLLERNYTPALGPILRRQN